MLNSICLMGRLVKDPDLRKTNGGQSVASFRLASDESYSGEGQEKKTIFIDVTVFGNRADTVAKYMRKGSLVAVVGRITQRKYLSTKTNTEVTVTEIVANQVEFAESKQKGDEEEAPQSEKQAPQGTIDVPTYVDREEPKSNLSGIDVIDDDLPF